MNKRIVAIVVVVAITGLIGLGTAHQMGLIPTNAISAQDGGNSSTPTGNSSSEDPPKDDTTPTGDEKTDEPEEVEVPAPELTEDGLVYTIPFERGDGSATLSRQNDLLRIDFDVHLPYSAGDGQGSRGSSIDLMLSVDGLHGRHLFYFPNPLWLPDGKGTLSSYRFEASYTKEGGAPQRLATEPTFVGESDVSPWASWTATMWVDLRLMILPGNSPASLADKWHMGMVIGNQAATVVFPGGMDMYNPAKAPEKMLSFKLSELPEIDELDDSPVEAITEQEKAMHESMRTIEAKLRVRDIKGTWAEIQASAKKWPKALWALNIQWLLSNNAAAQGLPDVDHNYIDFEKLYVQAGLGQSSAHLDYLYNLLVLGQNDAALAHSAAIFASPLCTERPATDGYMRLQWAERCITWGQVSEAEKQLNYIKQQEELLKDMNFRVDYTFQLAALEVRKGDSAAAVKVFEALLKDERKNLDTRQFNQIQQSLQFQRQAVEQWEDELKFQAEDAEKTNPRLVIETDKGKIVVELFEDDAPNTTAALVKLAKDEFYDGLNFHRVEPNFVAQGGCPNGDGTGSPGWRLKSEISRRNHFRGSFAMARSQRMDSQGCQFYICVSNNESVLSLSGKYVVAGRVIEGMEVADQLRVGDKIKSVRAENLRDHEYKPVTLPE